MIQSSRRRSSLPSSLELPGSLSSTINFAPSTAGQLDRRAITRRYQLVHGAQSGISTTDLDDLADLARIALDATQVLILADVENEGMVVLGRANDESEIDWDTAGEIPSSSLLLGRDAVSGRVLAGTSQAPFDNFACSPIFLPYSSSSDLEVKPISIGTFCVIRPLQRPSLSSSQLSQIASFTKLAAKELQRRYEASLRQKHEAQAMFIGTFLDLALAREETSVSETPIATAQQTKFGTPPTTLFSPSSSRAETAESYFFHPSHISPQASTSSSLSAAFSPPPPDPVPRHPFSTLPNPNAPYPKPPPTPSQQSTLFTSVAAQLCLLTPGTSSLILDVRAFSASSLLGKSFFEAALQVAGDCHYLLPISILGTYGYVETETEAVDTKIGSQDVLEMIQNSLKEWQDNTTGNSFKNNALSTLLPPSAISSLAVPILDAHNVPALIVLVGLPLDSPAEVDLIDKVFVKNVGALCLSTLTSYRAKKADRSKLNFISQIAHELRTPIHGLGGQLELLRDLCTPYELQKFSSLLSVSDILLDSLRDILDDSLDFAKLSSEVERGANQRPLATNDVVDLTYFLAEVCKVTWARRVRFGSSSDLGEESLGGRSIDSEKSDAKAAAVDIVLEFAERKQGWNAKVNVGELRRIVSNIVSNSLTFTEEGYVKIELNAAPPPGPDGLTTLVLVISDSGCGMTDDFLNEGQIWVPFHQADPFSPGCGLGMSIVQDLVHRMNGKLVVQSKLGQGTTVEVHLPIHLLNTSQPAPAVTQVLTGELGQLKRQLKQRVTGRHGFRRPTETSTLPPELSISKNDSLFDTETRTTPTASTLSNGSGISIPPIPVISPTIPTTDVFEHLSDPIATARLSPLNSGSVPSSSLKVFAAEDNSVARALLSKFLTNKGYSVQAVADGQKTVEEFKRGEFRQDVSVLDIGMPVMDGIQAASELRKHEHRMGWPRHKIVALTALASEAGQVGEDASFDDWIVKGGKALKVLELKLAAWQAELDAVEP